MYIYSVLSIYLPILEKIFPQKNCFDTDTVQVDLLTDLTKSEAGEYHIMKTERQAKLFKLALTVNSK